ncbi:MAG: LCP family protein [Symbiobacteriaceae bacterium]|nr:LCP family protein [Symbiobacteriaceae bacterium]
MGFNWRTAILIATMAVLVTSVATAVFFIGSIYETANKPWVPTTPYDPELPTVAMVVPEELAELTNRTNVLVMGVDEREWDAGRSDTMFVVSVPSDGGAISLISIPRDTMIWLPEVSTYDKISHLYNYRGPEFSTNAVSRLLDIPLAGYIVINLEGFVGLVDTIDGVTLDVGPDPLYYNDPYQDLYINIPAGVNHLNSEQAMHFVRYRNDTDADIGRIQRQHIFLEAVIKKIVAAEYSVTRIPVLLAQAVSMVTTNIPIGTLTSLAYSGMKCLHEEIHAVTLVGDGLKYKGLAYYILRFEESLEAVAEALFPPEERYAYVQEHLHESWVREYEWLRSDIWRRTVENYERTGIWDYVEETLPATSVSSGGGYEEEEDDPEAYEVPEEEEEPEEYEAPEDEIEDPESTVPLGDEPEEEEAETPEEEPEEVIIVISDEDEAADEEDEEEPESGG